MATLNLGRIKPVFRGAYSGATAYVVDDIVTHGNESFICIQAHGAGTQATSVTAYWTKLAAKGTDGTDVGTTITTQGDILYRDASGLARLGYGTSGHVLTTKGTGANPTWEAAVGGKILQVFHMAKTDTTSLSTATWTDVTGMTITITPTLATSSILVFCNVIQQSYNTYFHSRIVDGAGNNITGFVGDTRGSRLRVSGYNLYTEPDANKGNGVAMIFKDSPSSTSAETYKLQGRNSAGTGIGYYNRTNADLDSATGYTSVSTMTCMEVGV